ncbi:hypothetical protein WI28_23040 [Burkholderia diffusa]|uniref:hypothetical protein n=1 Tax=Burkholderia diffusa TaxID=488732 RepID=UPI000759B003|nr:hypothetical protein [Burkholderia diffusa]KUZ07000.1 hypothetical protein WI28_23040 [Burkholderia diffusa]
MKKLFAAALAALMSCATIAQTFPVQNLQVNGSATIATPLSIGSGGTGAATGTAALSNLGAGTIATQNANAVAITGGSIGVATNVAAAGYKTKTVNGGTTYSTAGSLWQSQGHDDWNVVQSAVNYNPTEWQVYGAQGQGKAHCDNPGVTGVVDWDSGSPFDSAWAGRTGFYMDSSAGPNSIVAQTVSSVTSSSKLTLSTTCQGSGSMTFHYVTTTNDGTVNVNGTAVTWVSGQPFNVFTTGANQWTINGAAYTCSAVTATSATCNTSGTATGVAYHTDSNINDEIATIRLQKVLGANEENLACQARAVGAYDCTVQFAGAGTLWPFRLGDGNASYSSAQQFQVALQPNGDLTLGGDYLKNTILVPGQTGQYNTNFMQMAPGLSGSGTPTPSIAARKCGVCSDTAVGLTFDMYGAGVATFTSHSYGNTEFQVFGNGGTSWLGVGSSSSANIPLSANGSPTNISLNLLPKGTGTVQINGNPIYPVLSGTSASIGGSALGAGSCSSTVVTINGATTSMVAAASPVTDPGGGFFWKAYVSSTNGVTVSVCAAVAGTPAASTYNVRVMQ